MKPYLYAPVIIAGLITLAGTATVASSELHLVRTGQQVASLFEIRTKNSVDFDTRQLDAMNYRRDSAEQLKDAIRLNRLVSAANNPVPAPDVDINATPAEDFASTPATTDCPKERAREVRHRARKTNESHTSLASQYTYTIPSVPSLPKEPSNIYLKAGSKMPVVQLSGFHISGKDGSSMRFVFNSKEFSKEQKKFAEQMGKARFAEWKKNEALSKLPMYHIAIGTGPNELPQIVTIDAGKLAADAEKLGEEAGTPAPDSDQEQMIATPSK